MAKGHWRAAHIPKSSSKRRFTDAQRAAYWKNKYLDLLYSPLVQGAKEHKKMKAWRGRSK